jgi:hypothetical protein
MSAEAKRLVMKEAVKTIEYVGDRSRRLQLKSRLTSNFGLGEKMRNLRRYLKFYEVV